MLIFSPTEMINVLKINYGWIVLNTQIAESLTQFIARHEAIYNMIGWKTNLEIVILIIFCELFGRDGYIYLQIMIFVCFK